MLWDTNVSQHKLLPRHFNERHACAAAATCVYFKIVQKIISNCGRRVTDVHASTLIYTHVLRVHSCTIRIGASLSDPVGPVTARFRVGTRGRDESRQSRTVTTVTWMRRKHAGCQCRQTWSTLSVFALGQHTGSPGPSPYLCGTRCGVQNSAAELRNVPRAYLATGQAQAVPIYRPSTQGRSIMGNNVKIGLLLLFILTCYCLLLPIMDLPTNRVSVLTEILFSG